MINPFVSADDLRQGDGDKESFTVPLAFDAVVANEFFVAENCQNPELNVGYFGARRTINREENTASVVYGWIGGVNGFTAWQVIDIVGRADGTEIHTSTHHWLGSARFVTLAEKWALGSKKCHPSCEWCGDEPHGKTGLHFPQS